MQPTPLPSPFSARIGARHAGRVALIVLAAGVGLAGCSGSQDRKLAQTVGDSTAPGQAAAAAAPTPPPTPPKAVSPECGALNLFQLMNFTIGAADVPKEKEQKDEAVRTLETTAAGAAGKIPELQSSFKMIVLHHKGRLEGTGDPQPTGGDPTVVDAGAKIGTWAKDHDC